MDSAAKLKRGEPQAVSAVLAGMIFLFLGGTIRAIDSGSSSAGLALVVNVALGFGLLCITLGIVVTYFS